MNRTRSYTFILVSLFILSLFLISQTLLDEDMNLFSVRDEVKQDDNKDLVASKIIVPKEILINYSEETHTLVSANDEYDLWENIREVLDDVFSYQDKIIRPIEKEEVDDIDENKSIRLEFAENIPVDLFVDIFDAPLDIFLAEDEIDSIKEIYLNLEEDNYIIVSDGENYAKIEDIAYKDNNLLEILDEIKNSPDFTNYWPADKSLGTKSDIYIPYKLPKDKKDIIVENDIKIDNSVIEEQNVDDIAEGFFDKDLSYLRKVVDSNGVIIYMYDQNTGLLVYPNGMVEYSSNIDEKENEIQRDLLKSFDSLVDFIDMRDRLPENSYISKIEEIEAENGSKGYRFVFSYNINGKKVYINNKSSEENNLINPLIAEVYGENVVNYKRFYRDIVIEETNSYDDNRINPEEVIEKNIVKLKQDFTDEKENITNNMQSQLYKDIIRSIEDISLGYYDKSSSFYKTPLIDSWIIDIKDTRYIFDSSTGDLIDFKELR